MMIPYFTTEFNCILFAHPGCNFYQEYRMIQKELTCFSLEQIAGSGQCFRLTPCPEEAHTYTVISKARFLKVSQEGNLVTFFCDDEEFPFWEQYFDLKTDYDAFRSAINPKDSYLRTAADFGRGIRILRQDPWEMIITFIISQQKTIPAIRQLVEALSLHYGTKLPVPGNVYAFPTPEQLADASLEDLLSLKLGYRAKYIKKICTDAREGTLDLNRLEALPYEEAMEYLVSFYGIGEKVANCICLFGLHHIDAFPVDTWIKKILLKEYAPKTRLPKDLPQSRLCGMLIQKHFSRYHGFAGVMQQYIFYYEREIAKGRPVLSDDGRNL